MTPLGCLVCVICRSEIFHSFILKHNIMIVHTLKMCTFYFWCTFHEYFLILVGVELKTFFPFKVLLMVMCVICNSDSFHFFIFKLYIMNPSEMLKVCLVCVICNTNSFHSFIGGHASFHKIPI